ncbi:MAG: CRISPR-associated helicase Cas3' [Acetobacteraceae bacterium]
MTIYAHSRPGRPQSEWEPLARHAAEVGEGAASAAGAFGWESAARAAGLLHDAGKCSAEFQARLHEPPGRGRRVDHSTKGATLACELYGIDFIGRMLALCIAGHHAGLPDPEELDRRISGPIPNADRWHDHIAPAPKAELKPSRKFPSAGSPVQDAFAQSLLVRMLFSCLVDADFLATERFLSDGSIRRGISVPLATLERSLERYLEQKEWQAKPTRLNALRREIRLHAQAKAAAEPGFFRLTVPTGGGKTLTSLGFALRHALRHGKRRVIYVIPFTSIIEQTAEVFREALGTPEAILEHHASFDWEAAARRLGDGGDEQDGLGVLRRAAENWDAPITVTTAVQFFESLFASRTSSARKLHNVADSVIVLDEAQMLPTALLLPCLAALRELVRTYGASVVLCTATQPAFRIQDETLQDRSGEKFGLDIPDCRELAPDPPALYKELWRVRVEVLAGTTDDAAIAQRFAEAPRMLCIVNSRRHARELFERIAHLPGAAHLSTLMCAQHRSEVLARLKAELGETSEPVRLVSTSLIEAGVDIDFPEVWRATTGVDSIAQAAGRCNRESRLPEPGRVVVFTPAAHAIPRSMASFERAARGVLRDFAADPLSLAAVEKYFRELYFVKGIEAFDATEISGQPGVLKAIRESAARCRFPFRTIAERFRLIDEVMTPVVVPWRDTDAIPALERLALPDRPPSAADFLALQRFTVGIPRRALDQWLSAGVVVPARASLGEALLRFADDSLYRERTGIDLSDPTYRRAESNIV